MTLFGPKIERHFLFWVKTLKLLLHCLFLDPYFGSKQGWWTRYRLGISRVRSNRAASVFYFARVAEWLRRPTRSFLSFLYSSFLPYNTTHNRPTRSFLSFLHSSSFLLFFLKRAEKEIFEKKILYFLYAQTSHSHRQTQEGTSFIIIIRERYYSFVPILQFAFTLLIRVLSLFLSLLLLQLVSFIPLIKKREQLSHREKNQARAKIIATTATRASVARTFWRAKRTRVKVLLPFSPFFLDVDVEMCASKRLFVKRRRRRGEKIRQIHLSLRAVSFGCVWWLFR